MQIHRTPLDQLALGTATAEHVATERVRSAFDLAVRSLDRHAMSLDIGQHALLMAYLEDGLKDIGFEALKLGAAILIEEEREALLARVGEGERLAAFIPTLIDFAQRVQGEHHLEEGGTHGLHADLLAEVFDLSSDRAGANATEGEAA